MVNGEEILRSIIREQLKSLTAIPPTIRREDAGGAIYAFCLGAAVGLQAAGFLSSSSQEKILNELGAELEKTGLGSVVKGEISDSRDITLSLKRDGDEKKQ